MDVFVLNTSFEVIKIIDEYDTLIWTERYSECGDFELYLPITSEVFEYIKDGYYLALNESERMMIIENIQIDTDVESEPLLFVSGRSLESILDRRIVWEQFTSSGQFQSVFNFLITKNIVSPTDGNRKIENFKYVSPTSEDSPAISKYTLDVQFTGDNIYDIVSAYCSAYGIGFKITLDSADNKFAFQLYSGKDRSYDQDVNPYVVFSTKYDNLLSSNYVESNKNLKTVALVAGEGEGSERVKKTVERYETPATGLDRRELYVDARDLSKTTDSNYTMSDSEYDNCLGERGQEKLLEYNSVRSFEGSIEPDVMHKFGQDYFVGDIVQIVNEYNLSGKSRITEVVRTKSASKSGTYPTFTKIE